LAFNTASNHLMQVSPGTAQAGAAHSGAAQLTGAEQVGVQGSQVMQGSQGTWRQTVLGTQRVFLT
jgi:hypothetical protein